MIVVEYLLLTQNHEIHTSVLRPTFVRCTRIDGLISSVPLGDQAIFCDAVFHERLDDSFGSILRKSNVQE